DRIARSPGAEIAVARWACAVFNAPGALVCLWFSLGCAGAVPQRSWADRTADRAAADVDTGWRRSNLAVDHDGGGSPGAEANADRRCGINDLRWNRVRADGQYYAADCGRNYRHDQSKWQRGRPVSFH